MNAIEAQLLQRSMEGLAGTLQQGREFDATQQFRQNELDAATQRQMQQLVLDNQIRQMQEARAEAAQKHYDAMDTAASARGDAATAHEARMEAKQDALNAKLEDQYKLRQHLDSVKTAQQGLKDGMMGLSQQVVTGKVSPDDATGYFRDSLDSMDDDVKSQILQNPVVNAFYNGSGDWARISQAPQPNVIHLPNGSVGVQDQKGNVKIATPPKSAPPPKQSSLQTTIGTNPNTGEKFTNTTSKVYLPPPSTPATPLSNPPSNLGGMPGAMTNNQASPRQLDVTTAAQFLRQAGGDRVKARQMAVDAGYSF